LYDIDNNIILKKVFKAEDLAKTLDSAKKWVLKLDVNDDDRQKQRGALDAVTESDATELSWSRQAMQTFYALDQAIQAVCKKEYWRSKSVGVLYACNGRFRTKLSTSIEKIDEEEYQIIKFDVQNKHIKVTDWEHLLGNHNFDFDFSETFVNTRQSTNLVDGEMSFA
jgi:hypothetical protein